MLTTLRGTDLVCEEEDTRASACEAQQAICCCRDMTRAMQSAQFNATPYNPAVGGVATPYTGPPVAGATPYMAPAGPNFNASKPSV